MRHGTIESDQTPIAEAPEYDERLGTDEAQPEIASVTNQPNMVTDNSPDIESVENEQLGSPEKDTTTFALTAM